MAACQEALERGAPTGAGSLPVSAEVWADADILFQWNDLEGAATRVEKAVTLGHRWGLGEAVVRTSTSLAWICRARGHLERARSLFADVERVMIGGQFRHPQTEHRWASFRLRWWIAERQVGRAASAAMEQGLTVGAPLTFQNEAEQLGLARLLLAEGLAEEASSLLGRLSHFTAAAGRVGRQIESLILHSLALAQQHDQASALDTLREALTLAEPEGYVRLFLDEGEPLAKLLARARGTATLASGDYADRLLAALGGKGTGDTRPTAGLVEPLSRREQEILRLIARGKTYQEIAHELIVAVSTVQHHVRSLYPKLDAHSGLEAVARAGQPGLLS